MYELKIYRGVLCHDIGEWCKIWRGIDLSVQNWYEEFDRFLPEHSKIPKICTLIGCFWRKCIMHELKKVLGSYVDGTEVDGKFEGNWLVLSKNFGLQAEK